MTNKDFFIQMWKSEAKTTAVAVRALPGDMSKLDYRPHPKSRSASDIIGHILPHAEAMMKATETFVMSEDQMQFKSIEEAATYFEKNAALLIEKLEKLDEKIWNEKIVPFMMHGNKIFEAPMGSMFWSFLVDIIHHRGQLSTYYRAMGMRNPSIYGPTAEDIEEQMAAMKN